jgi:catechol 2,3-dioxygenase-like lactoylglutathione lyase family enzyme
MFSHVMVGSNDIERSRKFYDALFAAIGGKPPITDPKGRLIYLHNGSVHGHQTDRWGRGRAWQRQHDRLRAG